MNNINTAARALAVPLLLSAIPALAVDYGAEAQKPSQAITENTEADKTAAKAKAAAADAGEDVPFSAVMANPDDPALNYKYARMQVRKGDLKGAAATLERMMMVNPALDDIRLFHAAVLYRMDDLAEAKDELDTLLKAQLPAKLLAEAQEYQKMIARRSRQVTASGSFTVGGSYDSNRNSSPDSKEVEVMGLGTFPLTGLNKARGDSALITAANAELRRPLAVNSKSDMFLAGTYYRSDQNNVAALSLGAISASAGVRLRSARSTLTPKLIYDNVFLDNYGFLQDLGASLRYDRKLAWNTGAYAEAKYLDQKFLATPDAGANPERTGGQASAAVGVSRSFSPNSQLEAEISFTGKNAASDYYASDSRAVELRHSWLLRRGVFLLTSAQLSRDLYRRADPMIDPAVKRKDTVMKGGVTLGLPAALLCKARWLNDLTLTLGYEHLRDSSNLTNYTYDSDKETVLFNYKWEAGIW